MMHLIVYTYVLIIVTKLKQRAFYALAAASHLTECNVFHRLSHDNDASYKDVYHVRDLASYCQLLIRSSGHC